ncbi:hypothetical protein ACWGJ2_00975 [Streptomyces sp. NPDC054796]
MARSIEYAFGSNGADVRRLVMAARYGETYDVDWDPNEGSWGVINGRGTFVQHTATREAARAAAQRGGIPEKR